MVHCRMIPIIVLLLSIVVAENLRRKDVVDVCKLPKETGPCKAYFRRWYYNRSDNGCLTFIYGGCGSNGNNFPTKETCERRCMRKRPAVDICKLKKESGPCRAYFIMYFYNAESNKCEKFVYGGCWGNDNRFRTMSACEKRCEK